MSSLRNCKGKKVKCDELKPGCGNCDRAHERCDYSIRLNWDGRQKRKSDVISTSSPVESQAMDDVTEAVSFESDRKIPQLPQHVQHPQLPASFTTLQNDQPLGYGFGPIRAEVRHSSSLRSASITSGSSVLFPAVKHKVQATAKSIRLGLAGIECPPHTKQIPTCVCINCNWGIVVQDFQIMQEAEELLTWTCRHHCLKLTTLPLDMNLH